MKLLNAHSRLFVIAAFFLLVILLAIASISVGTLAISPGSIVAALWQGSAPVLSSKVIWDIRLPRICTVMLVGLNLALAGTLLQGLLRNPLASPQVIGVNAGAGLVAVAVMVAFPGRSELIPPAAFTGALATVLLVYGLSTAKSNNAESNLVLAGMSIAALFTALTSGIMILHSDELEITYSWLIGGFAGKGWKYFHDLWPYSLVGAISAFWLSPRVNVFLLGEEMGKTLGLSVKLYRTAIIVVAAVLAGSAVSVAGTIGFVGLVSPHIARQLVGGDHRYLMPLSGCIGAGVLLAADTIARTIFQPVELPVGVITAVIGAPFFLYLLLRGKSCK